MPYAVDRHARPLPSAQLDDRASVSSRRGLVRGARQQGDEPAECPGLGVSFSSRRASLMPTPLHTRFWPKVRVTPGCWLWQGATNGRYGRICAFGNHGSPAGAHRVAWLLVHGPIPPGLFVCHRCDKPLCVNPDHLFLGTQIENMADCGAKGRHVKGELHARAKVTAAQVIEIRQRHNEGTKQNALAREFGVCTTLISRVVRRLKWRHVP